MRQRIQAVGHVSAKAAGTATQSLQKPPPVQPDCTGGLPLRPSVVDTLYQQGSARIRMPHVKPGPLHAVLLNTAGGLTGDDRIHWQAGTGPKAHLTVSTAACEKLYRTHGPEALQHTTLSAEAHSRLEWLPQESIVFDGAALRRTLHARVHGSAEALICESLVLGRQAMGEPIGNIRVHDRWRIEYNGQLLHAEDLRLNTAGQTPESACMLGTYRAISTAVLVAPQRPEWFEQRATQISELAARHPVQQLRAGISTLPSRLVVRVLASDSFQLRQFLLPCLMLMNHNQPIPTVWNV